MVPERYVERLPRFRSRPQVCLHASCTAVAAGGGLDWNRSTHQRGVERPVHEVDSAVGAGWPRRRLAAVDCRSQAAKWVPVLSVLVCCRSFWAFVPRTPLPGRWRVIGMCPRCRMALDGRNDGLDFDWCGDHDGSKLATKTTCCGDHLTAALGALRCHQVPAPGLIESYVVSWSVLVIPGPVKAMSRQPTEAQLIGGSSRAGRSCVVVALLSPSWSAAPPRSVSRATDQARPPARTPGVRKRLATRLSARRRSRNSSGRSLTASNGVGPARTSPATPASQWTSRAAPWTCIGSDSHRRTSDEWRPPAGGGHGQPEARHLRPPDQVGRRREGLC